MKTITIALPTYNEAENIEELIRQIRETEKELLKKNWEIQIQVIDDNSPDQTAEIVKRLQQTDKKLHLIQGQKEGLGKAYIRGINHILKTQNPDYIMEMDADLQHNPKDILRFAEKADQGYEFIIGSRYVAGGDYPDLSFKRKLYSWGANFIARYIAGIYSVEDCTSGFRCISAKFLRSIQLEKLKTNGYAFQMSLLHSAYRKKIKIMEIPILFPNRLKGQSKLGKSDIKEFFINAFKLRFKKYK